ncbi:hypothetical protein CAL12_18505 [Bordetella genomosp. 8]|uniref:Uncharacterized protein n=1 Tax=Bordetella genomosp. 8 TaxID=1416806 RepID=A0A1W6YNW0_9BORD|nr:hypothetical protein [Bordetella genomosp. 8]ARP82609.1 hypothetical protein CAL12_18505 [Bordetella genomosp. 8]
MNDPHQLYIDLRKTDRLIAEWRHQLDCQYRMIATLRRQRALAWREKLRAREMENRIAALSAHRDALIRTAAALQRHGPQP